MRHEITRLKSTDDPTVQAKVMFRNIVSDEVHILGAGLSGLAAATILARSGKDVHVHEIRKDSGARFDGDFQGIENWTGEVDFFDELAEWGFDTNEFKSDAFGIIDLIHPDDVVTHPETDGVAFRVVERGTSGHTIDQGFQEDGFGIRGKNPLWNQKTARRMRHCGRWAKRIQCCRIRRDL